MGFLNEKLWKSAYLIEFYKDGGLQDAFTFSVPPQSEEFVFAQRVNETKTFGGSVIDDYGNDTVKITLSGTTINQDLKIIYRSSKGNMYLSGQDEIFYLKDLLQKYGNYDNLSGKEVRLYALDSGKVNRGSKNQKSWRIFINELNIKRSKDMPFTYYYTLSAIGVPIELSVKATLLKNLIDSMDKAFDNFTSIMDVGLSNINNILGYIDVYKDLVSNIKNKIETVGNYIDAYLGMATGAINKVSTAIEETVSLQDVLLSTSLKIIPTYTATSLYNATTELWASCKKMKDWWGEYTISSEFNKLCSTYNESEQQMSDMFNKAFCEMTNSCSTFVASVVKQVGTSSEQAITVPGNGNNDDTVIIAKGYQEYTYTSGDTWATISQQFYNSSEYAAMLQLYNSDIDLSLLTAGDIIYIPKISLNASNILMANEVYTEPNVKDIYGNDISITNNGDIGFSVKQGDFKVVSGVENLNQAILDRLSTSINTRVRNVVYGIRNETGSASVDSAAIASYITSSIEQTILADPRVDTIEDLIWSSDNGESINVSVVYKTTTGNIGSYTSRI